MDHRSKQALQILAIALVEGLLGDFLLRQGPFGLGICLWLTTLVLALWWLKRGGQESLGPGRWLILVGVGASTAQIWRDSEALRALDGLLVVVSLALSAWYARGGSLAAAGLTDYVAGGLTAVGRGLISVPELLGKELPWKELPRGRFGAQAGAVVKGLLLAVPALLLFGGLFMAADPVFEKLVTDTVSLQFDFSHVVLTGIYAILSAGFIGAWERARQEIPAPEPNAKNPWLGQVEMTTVLVLIDALFLAFVAVQFRYLFGGAAHVAATTDLTYAEYARRGFFELVTVAALVLPLLLGAHWVIPGDRPAQQRWFRVLAGVLLALLGVVMVSAIQRMRLYQQEFGLTELRLYTTAFMGWLALLVLWFGATVLRGRRERFAVGALVSGVAVLVALHAINPDGLIARVNLARGAEGHEVDMAYLTSLSADAAPAVLAAAQGLPPEERATVLSAAQDRWGDQSDWRNWNWGRSRAARALPAGKD